MKVCKNCSVSFEPTRTTQNFCSIRCGRTFRRHNASGKEVVCQLCGVPRFLKHPSAAGTMCQKCSSKIGSKAAALNKRSSIDRFSSQVALSEQGCLEWLGTRQSNGYGSFYIDGSTVRAHRYSYSYAFGPIPPNLEINHLCKNRRCVLPEHLEAVTHRENVRWSMRTHCINGHEFSVENTYMHQNKRHCKICRREANRRRVGKHVSK